MASSNAKKADNHRPRPLHVSKSFPRIEPTSPGYVTRTQRACTVENGESPMRSPERAPMAQDFERLPEADLFEKQFDGEEETLDDSGEAAKRLSPDFDELPIELISLTDSFIDSLSAKVHKTPPTVDRLSTLFQDFYQLAATHINTHILTLSSRQHRERSPTPSVSSRSSTSTAGKIRAKAVSIGNKDRPKIPLERKDSDQQMLTAEEISDRKKARKELERKRLALEEAVERRVCEGIYDQIWRHRSTQDEAQDEKLRSKTAALSVVGIGLTDLGIDLGEATPEKPTSDRETEVCEWLQGARDELLLMNNMRYPLGKLQHLKAAHKGIVDTLSHFHPSSSADEIMPMLIYTLITSPPEGINVISNLYFIQRFRSESKIDGEAAYCLTNLEAAITFLETVDLASLRADEALSGPPKFGSQPPTPKLAQSSLANLGLAPLPGLTVPSLSPATVNPLSSEFKASTKPLPSPASPRPGIQIQNRRLSELFQPPAQVLGAAGDAVLNTADQGFKTIGSSLGDSYKFLLGKLKERQESTSDGQGVEILVPKTLDDARKLVGTPPPEDDASLSGASSLHSPETASRHRAEGSKPDEKVLSLIGGRIPTRDRSTDSNRSSGSGKKVAFAEDGKEKGASPLGAPNLTANPALVESMRSLGNTFNPMTRIAGGMGMMRGFARSTVPTPLTSPAARDKAIPDGGVADLSTTFPDLVPSLPPKEPIKIAPPIKRFMEVQNPGELRINEVLELLRDYRRLATALKEMGAI